MVAQRVSLAELESMFREPLFDLLSRARGVYAENWARNEVQLCTLLSIKTGGCSEDCSYCAQSAHHATGLEREALMDRESVLAAARDAKARGSTRFCMGAAWRGVREGEAKFDAVLGMVREVSALGLEVCVTLGELTPGAARALKEAGVSAYNHNIDTSPEHYPSIVSTHSFEDRLRTIQHVQEAGMSVCCGGILGLGETERDRMRMIEVLAAMDPPPESIPINCLTAIPGTPLEEAPPVDVFDLVRMIAVCRIVFPRARIRLSAGRNLLSREGQALCFYAGANSIFFGNKLLTTRNPESDADLSLLRALGLKAERSFEGEHLPDTSRPTVQGSACTAAALT